MQITVLEDFEEITQSIKEVIENELNINGSNSKNYKNATDYFSRIIKLKNKYEKTSPIYPEY